jgi:hypothetical protein
MSLEDQIAALEKITVTATLDELSQTVRQARSITIEDFLDRKQIGTCLTLAGIPKGTRGYAGMGARKPGVVMTLPTAISARLFSLAEKGAA